MIFQSLADCILKILLLGDAAVFVCITTKLYVLLLECVHISKQLMFYNLNIGTYLNYIWHILVILAFQEDCCWTTWHSMF